MNRPSINYYCECCFEPVTPVSINTTHNCDPVFRAKREREQEEYHEMISKENDDYIRMAYESAEEIGDDVWWTEEDIMLKGVPNK